MKRYISLQGKAIEQKEGSQLDKVPHLCPYRRTRVKVPGTRKNSTCMTGPEYIRKFTPAVLLVTTGTGLFPSVMMAQAILERSDSNGIPGNSMLARIYHNHFGIKADKSWKGKSIVLKTKEVIDGKTKTIKDSFRIYDDPLRSFLTG